MDRAAALRAAVRRSRQGLSPLLLLVLASCQDELPALGEALFIVDTDLPVPLLASELRLDVYTADGATWYESRTIPLPDPRDWPPSFSLYDPDAEVARSALVRLRIYPRGKVRDYRGERFAPRPVGLDPEGPAIPEPPPDEAPRLVVDGEDVTPRTEPQPGLTVDRLVRLELAEGERGSVRLLLRSDCVGTMADVAGQRTCTVTEAELVPVEQAVLNEDMTVPTTSQQGSFGAETPCTAEPRPGSGAPLFDAEACVPGAAYIFGNADHFGAGEASGIPERMAVLAPFRFDKYEVTVGRWRQALAEGFVGPAGSPRPNDDELQSHLDPSKDELCTWSTLPLGREDYPLNCVSWDAARAFCQFYGGDLPTVAQWEYVAQVAGRLVETRYPWGNAEPTCERAVFGRLAEGAAGFVGGTQCFVEGFDPGPQRTHAPVELGGDVSLGLGVVQLGGSMMEWLLDAYVELDENCWAAASLHDPGCFLDEALVRSVRGGFWASSATFVYPGHHLGRATLYEGEPADMTFVGFRCARSGEG